MRLGPNAQLAFDTLLQTPTKGIPTFGVHLMEHRHIERLAGAAPGDYRKNPDSVYLTCKRAIGSCVIDQYIPENPLSLGNRGYEGAEATATTGARHVEVDGMLIDSPEAVVEHMERITHPDIRKSIDAFDEDTRVREITEEETALQEHFGPDILKTGYRFIRFPYLRYGTYGYENYFMAYALYPEVMEKDFALQADLALLNNRAAARAYEEAKLPPLFRLDHDMADSRGTLVNVRSLEKLWFPHFARCLEPVLGAGVRLIWHCDGNLMQMVPRLLEVGLSGFQGFQYEDGMDYERICGMKTRDGRTLIIVGGVSVTRTLPMGTPDDVRRELRRLVKNGPPTGLFLAASSSVTPGVPWENVRALVDGLGFYRTHGRSS